MTGRNGPTGRSLSEYRPRERPTRSCTDYRESFQYRLHDGVRSYRDTGGSVQIRDYREPGDAESPRRSRLPRLVVVRKSEIFVITEDRRSSERRSSLRCGVLARRRRASGPRDLRSLAVVGARRRLPEGAYGSLSACLAREGPTAAALSVRQDPVGQPAEPDPLDGPYLNTAMDHSFKGP